MKVFSLEHVGYLIVTFAFLAVTIFLVSRMPRFLQNVMFFLAAFMCAGGIFFRYAMGLSFDGEINLGLLAIQLMQVCNFNFLLLPLMLVPKFEVARQYSAFFSMFAAFTALISFSSSFAVNKWSDTTFVNFWLNHTFAIALPLWMMAAKRLTPKRRYVLPVTFCVICYFTAVYGISSLLNAFDVNTYGCTFSYVYDPQGVPILTQLYKIIGGPYVHLLPIIPALVLFFFAFSLPFPQNVEYGKYNEDEDGYSDYPVSKRKSKRKSKRNKNGYSGNYEYYNRNSYNYNNYNKTEYPPRNRRF